MENSNTNSGNNKSNRVKIYFDKFKYLNKIVYYLAALQWVPNAIPTTKKVFRNLSGHYSLIIDYKNNIFAHALSTTPGKFPFYSKLISNRTVDGKIGKQFIWCPGQVIDVKATKITQTSKTIAYLKDYDPFFYKEIIKPLYLDNPECFTEVLQELSRIK